MGRLGQLLQQRRQELGLSLDDLQQRTKIRGKYLQAIEAGDYHQIPGEVYLRGFIRLMAGELGIDANQALELYQQDISPVEPKQPDAAPKDAVKTQPAPVVAKPPRQPVSRVETAARQRKSLLGWGILLVILAVALVGYLIWSNSQPDVPNGPPVAGSDLEDPLDPPGGETLDPPEPAVQIVLQNPGENNLVYLVSPGPLQVRLVVEGGRCWIGGTVDGEDLETTLQPGEDDTLDLEAEEEIAIRLGNPLVLRLIINGVDQGILGGENPRNLTITVHTPA
ncbi:MAG: helix-turn-helix domain-containing protein [Bacillota bacterium]|jgi:cytoskeleton protein RodZ